MFGHHCGFRKKMVNTGMIRKKMVNTGMVRKKMVKYAWSGRRWSRRST